LNVEMALSGAIFHQQNSAVLIFATVYAQQLRDQTAVSKFFGFQRSSYCAFSTHRGKG
jgi:hypothetical protein